MICQFQTYIFKKNTKLRKNSPYKWFTPFNVLIRPNVIWKNLSRPMYHVHFTVIHTNSLHKPLRHWIIVMDQSQISVGENFSHD